MATLMTNLKIGNKYDMIDIIHFYNLFFTGKLLVFFAL